MPTSTQPTLRVVDGTNSRGKTPDFFYFLIVVHGANYLRVFRATFFLVLPTMEIRMAAAPDPSAKINQTQQAGLNHQKLETGISDEYRNKQ